MGALDEILSKVLNSQDAGITKEDIDNIMSLQTKVWAARNKAQKPD